MLYDVKNEIWQKAVWTDEKGAHKCLFNDRRFEPATVPSHLHMYQIRHDDEHQGDWAQIKKGIMVNFWGTILTEEEIDFDSYTDGSVYVKDYAYEDETALVDPEYDVVTIFTENGKKMIRFEGYGYCAGDSATENAEQIYRFIDFSNATYPLKEVLSYGFGDFSSKICEDVKQTITDQTWEELQKTYLSYARMIKDSDSLTTDLRDGSYLILIKKEEK